jgi:hypothetical protein
VSIIGIFYGRKTFSKNPRWRLFNKILIAGAILNFSKGIP